MTEKTGVVLITRDELQQLIDASFDRIDKLLDKHLQQLVSRAEIKQEDNEVRVQKSEERKMLTVSEAAEYLRVKPSYIYKLTMNRAIPYYKPRGKVCYFDKEDLDAHFRQIRIAPQSEIDERVSAYMVRRRFKNDFWD